MSQGRPDLTDLQTIRLEVTSGVAWLSLDRPEAANARNQRMRHELSAAYRALASDSDVRVVVLTAEGDRAFCAGMDLKEAGHPETPLERRSRLHGARDIEELANLPKPTIAAINGVALGGGMEMALACDLRFIAAEATVGFPEVGHGLMPGGGATQRLPRLVGPETTFQLLYLGERIDGERAAQLGLASRCVPRAELRSTVAEVAERIARGDPGALALIKEHVRLAAEVPLTTGISAELDGLLSLLAHRQVVALQGEGGDPAEGSTSLRD
jgi:enoyl-CoA hydratase